ncbi:MAG: TIGR04282 family arsenosugar biosynthesis glycosyltransferase [Myxococcota bacterium]|nr:TIGR04282 family arsenosugar biosynthesis glycosyltransferase [Myxococcota bacterium]
MSSSPKKTEAIVVMGRVPKPGKVKTRLTSKWSKEEAALLYEAFVKDVARLVDQAAQQRTVVGKYFCCVWESQHEERLARALIPSDWIVFQQTTGGLGERIEHARRFTESKYVLVLGSDSPAMKPQRITSALDALVSRSADVVIGPVEDGGYDLIGFSGSKPAVLDAISWSTDQVLSQTRQRAFDAGYTIEELDLSFDIDFPDDLERTLQMHENNDDICPHTARTAAKLKANKS